MGIGELTTYNTFDRIEPARSVDDIDGQKSYCTGLAADDEYLYAAMSGTVDANTMIYKGAQLTDSSGNTKWAWCPLAFSDYYSGCLFHDAAVARNRIWFCNYVTTASRYIVAGRLNPGSYLTGEALKFASSGHLDTSWFDAGNRDWMKFLDAVLCETKMSSGAMDAGKKVTISYAIDDSPAYTQIDTPIIAATMGTKKYVDDTPGAFKKIRFRIALATDSETVTPVVKYFAAYGSIQPPRKQLIEFYVNCETGFSGKAKDLRDFLFACRDIGVAGPYASLTYLTLKDLYGTPHYVRFLPGYPVEQMYLNKAQMHGSEQPAVRLRVVCEKVDWS